MKLYHKQLKGIKDLKREKQRLRNSIRADKPSLTVPAGGEMGGTLGGMDKFAALLEVLPLDVIQGMLVRLGLPLLKKTGKAVGKNAFSIGKEIIGGYAKWKIMELAYRWGRRYIINQKEKKHRKGA